MAKEAYIVHKDGEPDTILLSANGRIVTEAFDMPAWAPDGVALAKLAERNDYYQRTLGAAAAAPILGSNLINVRDLNWVCVDEDGEEVEYPVDQSFRDSVLAAVIGIDLETGDIKGALMDHYLDADSNGYTAEEIVAKEEADKVFASGTQG